MTNNESDSKNEVRRPLGLSIILIVLMILNTLGAATVALKWNDFLAQFPRLTPPALAALAACAGAGVVACLAIWLWKKWGLVLVSVLVVAVLVMEIYFLGPTLKTLRIPLSYGLLMAFAWPVRRRFK
jgi:hypothetical protein